MGRPTYIFTIYIIYIIRVHAVRKSQDLGVPKSGQTTILIKVRNSQENGCQSQEKVGIFIFFAT